MLKDHEKRIKELEKNLIIWTEKDEKDLFGDEKEKKRMRKLSESFDKAEAQVIKDKSLVTHGDIKDLVAKPVDAPQDSKKVGEEPDIDDSEFDKDAPVGTVSIERKFPYNQKEKKE